MSKSKVEKAKKQLVELIPLIKPAPDKVTFIQINTEDMGFCEIQPLLQDLREVVAEGFGVFPKNVYFYTTRGDQGKITPVEFCKDCPKFDKLPDLNVSIFR